MLVALILVGIFTFLLFGFIVYVLMQGHEDGRTRVRNVENDAFSSLQLPPSAGVSS
jgi:hypothetical protein